MRYGGSVVHSQSAVEGNSTALHFVFYLVIAKEMSFLTYFLSLLPCVCRYLHAYQVRKGIKDDKSIY